MAARTLNLILALWLFVSAFAWPRTSASFTNAWVVGLLAAVFAVMGMTRAKARFADTALSAWLLVSAFVLPQRSPIARWNDLAVAVAMLLLSLVPGTMYRRTTTRAAA
ncbi:MAG TPA: hypothetical protein VLC54_15995 [Anaeromyxobacter sp.]|nr:hypothetical protein [Anaeromyxobacter sp.]